MYVCMYMFLSSYKYMTCTFAGKVSIAAAEAEVEERGETIERLRVEVQGLREDHQALSLQAAQLERQVVELEGVHHTSYTLHTHTSPYTLHSTPHTHTLHLTLYTLQTSQAAQLERQVVELEGVLAVNPTLQPPHPTPHTPHTKPYTLIPQPSTINPSTLNPQP